MSYLRKKAIFISSIGGGLEMYDFTIYVFFAPIIAAQFFPHQNILLSLINTFAVFAVGYLSRPIGALIFGNYGDSHGRKKGMLVTIIMMGLATTLIGLLPTYSQIGIFAPLLLFLLRFLQGVAVGGDLPGAMTFIGEHAEDAKRGLASSIVFCGVNLGILFASLVGTLLTLFLSQQHLFSWGWRIGFIFGLVIGIIGFYLRNRVTETPYFIHIEQTKNIAKIPFALLFKKYHIQILQGVGLACLFSVVIALIFLYMPTYLSTFGHEHLKTALLLNSINILIFSACIPLFGYLSDKIGRKLVLMIVSGLFIIVAFPIYNLLSSTTEIPQLLALCTLAVLSAGIVGVAPGTLVELFPTKVRYSGVALSYNVGFAVFAGLTPVIVTYLLYQIHRPQAPAYYLIFSAVVALLAVAGMYERSRKPLLGTV